LRNYGGQCPGQVRPDINRCRSQADNPSPKSQKIRIVEVKERFEEVPEESDSFGWGVLYNNRATLEKFFIAKFRYQVDAEEFFRHRNTTNTIVVELINE
jgi:hypothetical protein